MTIVYVHKKGVELNVGLTIKGTPGVNIQYNGGYLDTTALRTTPWCAGYYSLGGSHDHTENYYMKYVFKACGDVDDVINTGRDLYQFLGLMNSSSTDDVHNTLSFNIQGECHSGASYLDEILAYGICYSSDGTGAGGFNVDILPDIANNDDCELIMEYDGATKVMTAYLYINDILITTREVTFPSGKTASFDSIGVWGRNDSGVQLWEDPWRISEIYVGDGPPPDDKIGKKLVNVI